MLKKKVKQQQLITSIKVSEPVLTQENYRMDLMRVFNYHNANTDNKKYLKWLTTIFKKKDPSLVKLFNKAKDYELRYIAIYSYHESKGQYISDEDKVRVRELIDNLKQKYINTEEKQPEKKVEVDIQKRIYDTAVVLSDEIDYQIDSFITTKQIPKFSTLSYLQGKQVSGPVAKKIAEFYAEHLEEINEVIEGNDEDLEEGYSNFTKSQLKKFKKFIEDIINGCEQCVVSSKANRKPRVRKQKSPLQLVSKLQYMKEDNELTSVDPIKIIGSKEVWIYNTKYKKLFRYVAADSSGISVKGTTLLNYSTAESLAKTLRKPQEILGNLTKSWLNSSIKKLKTKPSAVNGRVNKDCIILKAF